MDKQKQWDIVIIGAGPAGLSAARTAARMGLSTVALEKLSQPGDLAHPCSGAIAPLPGFVSGRREGEILRFPELDLAILLALVVGWPTIQRYVSPSGYELRATFAARDDFPIAVVDKRGLLRLLAEEAAASGAVLRFGTVVTGLLREGERIVGVRTRQGEFRAHVILSAEGISRWFCEEAGLYQHTRTAPRYAFVVSEEMEAPAIGEGHVGQTVALGRRYTALPRSFGTVVVPCPGRASVYFAVFADGSRSRLEKPLWSYLNAFKERDPRVRDLFTRARVLHRSGCRLVIRGAPPRAVCDGFMGLGDAIAPGGQLGILPSIYFGQEAARVAAEAIRSGDVSSKGLSPYERLSHGPILRGLETESKIMTALARMSDEEIDRLCQTMSALNLAPFFFGAPWPILWETVSWVARGLPLICRDWQLIRQMMVGA